MKYKAVIFDVDGTILNSVEDVHDCINLYLKKFGYPERSLDDTKAAMGGGVRNLCNMLLPEGLPKDKFDEFFDEFVPYYSLHGKEKTAPYPGVLDLLADLKAASVKLAVISSKPQKPLRMLCAHYFDGIFDVQTGDNFIRKLKPAPDCMYDAVKELGVTLDEVMYVGDSEYDIAFAENAGTDCTAVLWGYRTRQKLEAAGARHIAENVDDLRTLIFSE